MNILVACEESQAVTIELRRIGHTAYSCDLLPCSGGYPEWHIQGDVLPLLREPWGMVIAFPPCTHLAVSGARYFAQKRADGRQQAAVAFFMAFADLPHVPRVAIENPVGIMSTVWRKPDQVIQPWQFGDAARKRTCLWLKGLPLLLPTAIVGPTEPVYIQPNGKRRHFTDSMPPSPDRARLRSKTFQGIARAMATQWTDTKEE
jgi:hypothetical protein